MTEEIEENRLNKENEGEEENPYWNMIIIDLKRLMSILTHDKWNNGQYLVML